MYTASNFVPLHIATRTLKRCMAEFENRCNNTNDDKVLSINTSVPSTHVHLLVVADGGDGGGVTQGLAALLEGHHRFRATDELVHGAVELRQRLPHVLHLPQQLLSVVQAEVRHGEGGIQLLVVAEAERQKNDVCAFSSLFPSNFHHFEGHKTKDNKLPHSLT